MDSGVTFILAAKFLKWNNLPSIFVILHYHFKVNQQYRVSGQTLHYQVAKANHIQFLQDKGESSTLRVVEEKKLFIIIL